MTEASGIEALGPWIAGITRHLTAPERRALARRVGTALRAADARRVKANVMPPNATPMPARKQHGDKLRERLRSEKASTRRGLMFKKAGRPAYLKSIARDDGASVGFVGAMARIMRVHQYGLKDHVTRDQSSPLAQYPVRRVIGFTDADREAIQTLVLEHLGR